MQDSSVRFNVNDRPEFFIELRKRVNSYFKQNNISRHANVNMVFKTIFMLTLYTTPLVLVMTQVVTSFWGMISMWSIMGLGMSGIGLSIMHDANHGAYSKSARVNNALGLLLNYIGGYHANWKIQHNVMHHSYTNIDGFDEDIEKKGVMRFSPNQECKWIYKFQVIYAPLFYCILTLYWFIGKDFEQLARYRKTDLLKTQDLTYPKALFQIILTKLFYAGFTLVLPIMLTDFLWWEIVLGFLTMHYICGLILALIFQSAHVLEETNFYVPDSSMSVENNWAIHQMYTTSNFANKSIFFSWFIGGLNYQIEHHLFPNICHVHYRHISKIVRETAAEFDIPYLEHKTFLGALRSHFSLLHQLGTGKYDRRVAAHRLSTESI